MRDKHTVVYTSKRRCNATMHFKRRCWTISAMFAALVLSGCSANGGDQAAAGTHTVTLPTADSTPATRDVSPTAESKVTAAVAVTATAIAGATVVPMSAIAVGSAAARATTLMEITQGPEAFANALVTVQGAVSMIKGDRAFSIADGTLPDAGEVLVISADKAPLDEAIETRAVVRVVGAVRELSVTEVERQFDFDLAPEFEAAFENTPVIVARDIQILAAADANGTTVTPVR